MSKHVKRIRRRYRKTSIKTGKSLAVWRKSKK